MSTMEHRREAAQGRRKKPQMTRKVARALLVAARARREDVRPAGFETRVLWLESLGVAVFCYGGNYIFGADTDQRGMAAGGLAAMARCRRERNREGWEFERGLNQRYHSKFPPLP